MLNQKQRLKLYKEIKHVVENGYTPSGFCYILSFIAERKRHEDWDFTLARLHKLPELMKREPRHDEEEYWFPPYQWSQRMKILNEAIKEIEDDLRITGSNGSIG